MGLGVRGGARPHARGTKPGGGNLVDGNFGTREQSRTLLNAWRRHERQARRARASSCMACPVNGGADHEVSWDRPSSEVERRRRLEAHASTSARR